MRTYIPKREEVQRKWYIVDAQGKILGRMASQIASILRGKTKPTFTPHLNLGDQVIVINADKVVLSGKKAGQKTYYTHSFYPGGLKAKVFSQVIKEKPESVFRWAVGGMLPKGRLGRKMLDGLHVYRGEKHPHKAQKPEVKEFVKVK
ncbi:MAG: 50S ribosomal protein L13 [candidate division Zixibacteria bacterium RBG-1]|nr:MAG: 50S ribosomal protein L13 [candidate division Zixibacteria bacterium RBG-1]OGC85736.1 MAG: 50S ribosomal protein L13 [candidate division Zixibacteria bacterium RBG_19FT_COMBO_42_43]